MDLKEMIELEKHKAQSATELAIETENFKAVILAGQNALKTALLINGSASVGLLATWKVESDVPLDLARLFAAPLLCFVAGVLLGAVAAGATYLAQGFYASSAKSREKFYYAGFALHVLVTLLVLGSYATFARGAYLVYSTLVE